MSSPIVWSDVTAFAAKLTTTATSAQTTILAYVNGTAPRPEVLDGEDGPTTRMARIFLAAHMGTILPTHGQVSSEAAGGLSRSYAVPAPSMEALYMTSFGRQYLGIVGRSLARFPIVG